jgi:hypothetical protein
MMFWMLISWMKWCPTTILFAILKSVTREISIRELLLFPIFVSRLALGMKTVLKNPIFGFKEVSL